MLFSFVDRLVIDGWKHPHLPYDLLPSLCDYDRSAYLREKGVRFILGKQDGRRRHLGIRIFFLYRQYLLFLAHLVALLIFHGLSGNENIFFICSLLLRALAGLIAPIAMNRLLSFIETGGDGAFVRPWLVCQLSVCGTHQFKLSAGSGLC